MPTDKEFEDILRNRFDDFEDEPPLEGWSKLQQDLQQHRFPKKRWPFSIIAIFLLIGLVWKEPTSMTQYAPAIGEAKTSAFSPLESQHGQKTIAKEAKSKRKEQLTSNGQLATDSYHRSDTQTPMLSIVAERNTPVQTITERKEMPTHQQNHPEQSLRIGSEPQKPTTSIETGRGIASSSRFKNPNKNEAGLNKPNNIGKEKAMRAKSFNTNQEDTTPREKINTPEEENATEKLAEKAVPTKAIATSKEGMPNLFPTNDRQSNVDPSEYIGNEVSPLSEISTSTSGVPFSGSVEIGESKTEPLPSKPVARNVGIERRLSVDKRSHRIDSLIRIQPVVSIHPVAKAKPKPDSDKSPTLSGSLPYTFGIYFSPRYAFSRFRPNQADNVLIENIRTEGKSMHTRLGYETGITCNRLLSDRWILNSNLVFIHLNETLDFSSKSTKPDSVTWIRSDDGSSIVAPHFNSHQQRYESSYHYVGLNLGASYSFWKRKQGSWYASGGGGLNILVRGKTNVYNNDTFVNTVRFPSARNPLEQMNYRISVGIGYAHRIAERAELTFEPTISYFLGSSFKEREPVGMKPYTLGLNVGLRFGR